MTPKTRDRRLTYLSVLVLLGILLLANEYADEYQVRILNMVAIYITLAVSYNLIN